MTAGITDFDALLKFWFGSGLDDPAWLQRRNQVWFGVDAGFDQLLRERFGDTLAAALQGELDGWAMSPRGALALVVVLDQLTRNCRRGTAEAFAGDPRALIVVRDALAHGGDRGLHPIERSFFYLPLEHSENRAAQEQAVALYTALAAEAPTPIKAYLEHSAEFARGHRDIIARFGRFPHRNAVLGRANTPAEADYLRDGGARFGQG